MMNKKSQRNTAGAGSKILVFVCMINAFYCREDGRQFIGCVVNESDDRDTGCGVNLVQINSNRYCAEPRRVQGQGNSPVFTVCDGCNDVICEHRYLQSRVGGLPAPTDRTDTDASCERHGNQRRCYVPKELVTPGYKVVSCRGFYFNDAIDNDDPAGPELQATFRKGVDDYEVKWHMNNGLVPNTIKVTKNNAVLIEHRITGATRQTYLTNYAKYFHQCRRNVQDRDYPYDWIFGGERTFFPTVGQRGPVNNANARIYF
jgi:hypothetical protein